jgi:hypothetical protein
VTHTLALLGKLNARTSSAAAPYSLTKTGRRRKRRRERDDMEPIEDDGRRVRGAGGTPGGVGEFLIGLAMAVAGAYMLTERVVVTGGFWTLWGYNSFGLSLLPLVVGVGLLFYDGRSIAGWLLTFAGVVIIFVGVLMNLQIYFQPTSLFNTVVMLVLLAGGLGLVARSLRPHL